MMGLIIMVFYLAVIFVIAGFVYLKANRDDLSFPGHIFHWWLAPLVAIMGLVFIDNGHKRQFFKNMESNLFIKKH